MRKTAIFGAIAFAALLMLSFGGRALADGCNGRTEPPISGGDGNDGTIPNPPDYGSGYFRGGGQMFDGKFVYANGDVAGDYVDFHINETTGEITDFTIKTVIIEWPELNYTDLKENRDGTINSTEPPAPPPDTPVPPVIPEPNITYKNITIFDSITVERFSSLQEPTVVGGMFIFLSQECLIMVYDAPFANLFYAATSGATGNNTVTFNLAEGLNASGWGDIYAGWEKNGWRDSGNTSDPIDNSTVPPPPPPSLPGNYVWITGKELSGSISVEGGIADAQNGTVTVTLETHGYASFYAFTMLPMFMEVLGPDLKQEDMYGMRDAMATGRVGAEITIGPQSGNGAAGQGSSATPEVGYNTQRYDSSLELRPLSYDSNKVEVEVSSQVSSGRVVIINVQKSVMPGANANDLAVKMDGNAVSMASDMNSALYASGTSAKAHIVSGTGGFTLIVYVPHFSVHTITLEHASVSGVATVLVPLLAGVAVTALAFGLIAHRRKKGGKKE